MGLIATYNEDADRIAVADVGTRYGIKDQVVKDVPAMRCRQFREWALDVGPNDPRRNDPKALRSRWLGFQPDQDAMLVVERPYLEEPDGTLRPDYVHDSRYTRVPKLTMEEMDRRVRADGGIWLETEECGIVTNVIERVKRGKWVEIKKIVFVGGGTFR